jgi:putative transposase
VIRVGAQSERFAMSTARIPPQQLIALDDGHRESSESWADLLRSCKRRGMRAPVLAVGDGAGVLESAARRVRRHERAAVLVAQDRQRPRRAPEVGAQGRQGRAGGDLKRRRPRPRREAAKAFAAAYGAKWPKAVPKITDDLDVLRAFYDFPGEHWIHLRTTNPIESTIATVRLRQRVTKGPGARAAGIAMAFKLIESAQHCWRAVNPPTSSGWSEPGRSSRTASSSSDPTNQQAVPLTPHDPLIHRP